MNINDLMHKAAQNNGFHKRTNTTARFKNSSGKVLSRISWTSDNVRIKLIMTTDLGTLDMLSILKSKATSEYINDRLADLVEIQNEHWNNK